MHFEVFRQLSNTEDEGNKFNFYVLNDEECKEKYGVKDGNNIMIFRNKFNTEHLKYSNTNFLPDSIRQWMWNKVTPPGIEFTQETYDYVLHQKEVP